MRRKPEMMSPAGYWPQLHAAIEAGADAVYFGLKHFSARAKVGFSLDELPQVMRTLHARGVRGFLTFNTLVFEHELPEAARTIAAIARAGADAMIVQDYGIVRLVREIAPDMELHASTQMSITNVEGVELAQSFGIQRVNLARELSLDEVRAIVAKTGCELRYSSMERCAWRIRGSVFRRKLGEGAARIGDSARRRAGCLTRCWSMGGSSRWAMRVICFRPAIFTHWSNSRKSSKLVWPR